MADLIASVPLPDMPLREVGAAKLQAVDLGVLTSVAVYKGQAAALSEAMQSAHGMGWPAPNRATGKDGARAIWFGLDQCLLVGPEPDAQLVVHAALTDQSDAWVSVRLSGASAEDVLARLVPLDLRNDHFKRGHTARTQVQHVNAAITRISADAFLILAFRSMAKTLWHDLEFAMESVAARG